MLKSMGWEQPDDEELMIQILTEQKENRRMVAEEAQGIMEKRFRRLYKFKTRRTEDSQSRMAVTSSSSTAAGDALATEPPVSPTEDSGQIGSKRKIVTSSSVAAASPTSYFTQQELELRPPVHQISHEELKATQERTGRQQPPVLSLTYEAILAAQRNLMKNALPQSRRRVEELLPLLEQMWLQLEQLSSWSP